MKPVPAFSLALAGFGIQLVATRGSENEQNAGEHPLLAALRQADSLLEQELSATFDIRTSEQFRNPDCAQQTTMCTYTSIDGMKALSRIYSYDRDLPYQATEGPGCQVSTILPNGTLHFWRGFRMDTLWLGGVSWKRLESEPLTVTPQGLITHPEGVIACQSPYTRLEKHSLGNFKSMPVFDQFQMALGRGFSKHLQRVKSDRLLMNGLRELAVDGQWGEGSPGEWILRVTTGVDPPLVREAEFFGAQGVRWTKCADDPADGSPSRDICFIHDPLLCIQSTGLMRLGGLSLAEKGSITYSPNSPHPQEARSIDFALVDFSTRPNRFHVNQVRARVSGPFPVHIYMTDYTGPSPVEFPVKWVDLVHSPDDPE
jgi:hypothetical protein